MLSPVTHAAGTPAASARSSIRRANSGLVANATRLPLARPLPFAAALKIVCPVARQVEFPIQRDMSCWRRIGQQHANPAVFNPSSRSTVLPLDAYRLGPLV